MLAGCNGRYRLSVGSTVIGTALVVAGSAVAVLGLVVGMLVAGHRRLSDPGTADRLDPWFTVMVAGLVVVIVGAGDLVLLVLSA